MEEQQPADEETSDNEEKQGLQGTNDNEEEEEPQATQQQPADGETNDQKHADDDEDEEEQKDAAVNEPLRQLFDLVSSPEDALRKLKHELHPFLKETLEVVTAVYKEIHAFLSWWSINHKGKSNALNNVKFEPLAIECYEHAKNYVRKWRRKPIYHQASFIMTSLWSPKSESKNTMEWKSTLYSHNPPICLVMRMQDNLFVWRRVKHLLSLCFAMKYTFVYSWQDWSGLWMLSEFESHCWLPYCIKHVERTIEDLEKHYCSSNNSRNKISVEAEGEHQ